MRKTNTVTDITSSQLIIIKFTDKKIVLNKKGFSPNIKIAKKIFFNMLRCNMTCDIKAKQHWSWLQLLINTVKWFIRKKLQLFGYTIKQWGMFPVREIRDCPFYFPDREKNVKIFPVREIKWPFFIYLSILPGG